MIGYNASDINYGELKTLLENLHSKFSEKIFKWGAEQTIHGLILCGNNAEALPIGDYFVFTQHNATNVDKATFVHFVGENRFYKMHYPRLAKETINDLMNKGSDISPP